MNLLMILLMAATTAKPLSVTSPAFAGNDFIPSKYTCTGENISPELHIKEIPPNAQTLALIIDDPDAPHGTFDHWVMWNIPVVERIEENSTPGTQGMNGKKENKYTGPCPPSGTHHYHFKVYALDAPLKLGKDTDKKALMKAMEGHIITSGELVGVFKK